ncbi:hypothetical protein [Fodinicola acaciae]|uniref:hypothetical protein n=1 Tax=Fodinicola acaciae TaxID=2681555 RepID=UPI0013D5D775|nr:hypothetical protein [Fodinicola acaciae]
MDVLYQVLVALHLVGMAGIVGGWLFQLRSTQPRIAALMSHGSILQVITGVALVGIASAGLVDKHPNNTKIAVKLVIAVVVMVVALLNFRKQKASKAVFHTVGGLALLNVLVATLWTA